MSDPVSLQRSIVIAVDGPAASGKGTIARALAAHFGLPHMDTGLLYRAVALNLVRFGGDPGHEFEAVRACDLGSMSFDDPELRSEIVGSYASRISAYPAVRAHLLDRQRAFAAQDGGAVLDGRDIGTVIAPDAPAKLYVTASAERRAERRWKQLTAQGETMALAEVLEDIHRRDARDGGRDAAPMRPARDAVLLDTSEMTIEQAADAARRIVEAARARWEGQNRAS